MKTVFRLLLVGLCIGGPASSPAQAGETRAQKQCAKYRAKRATSEQTESSGGAEVDGLLVDGKVTGGHSKKKEYQELPEDVVRSAEKLYQNCLLWRDGILSTKQFNALVLRERQLLTEKGMRATERANQRAERYARKDQRATKKMSPRQRESSRHDSSFNRKFKKLLMWTGGLALVGGGGVVYYTSKTADETGAIYGPKNEWEDLQRMNLVGWEALAGGALVFYVGAKIQVNASMAGNGTGLQFRGAF